MMYFLFVMFLRVEAELVTVARRTPNEVRVPQREAWLIEAGTAELELLAALR